VAKERLQLERAAGGARDQLLRLVARALLVDIGAQPGEQRPEVAAAVRAGRSGSAAILTMAAIIRPPPPRARRQRNNSAVVSVQMPRTMYTDAFSAALVCRIAGGGGYAVRNQTNPSNWPKILACRSALRFRLFLEEADEALQGRLFHGVDQAHGMAPVVRLDGDRVLPVVDGAARRGAHPSWSIGFSGRPDREARARAASRRAR
jgi:hypothetical protein